jgi:hypothetical protein
MHSKYVSVLVAAWSQCLAVHAQTAPQTYPHKLTAVELRVFYPNSTVYAPGIYGPKTFTVYYSANGRITMRSAVSQDTGTWRITDDGLFCTKYVKGRGGQENCQTVWLTGPDSFENHLPSGEVAKATAHVSGNPDGL